MIEYNGLLPESTQEYVRGMANRYPYALEISHLPDNFEIWCKGNMKLHHQIGENCQGQPCCQDTHHWAFISKNSNDPKDAKFIFFSAMNERDAFLRDFPGLIINAEPFTVRF